MKEKAIDKFDKWMDEALKLEIRETTGFIR